MSSEPDSDEKILGELRKDDEHRLRVSVKKYKGRVFVDIRVYFRTPSGSLVPTKSGVSIGVRNYDAFIDMITAARFDLTGEEPF